jgi:phytoene/squalene synthetase
MTTGNRGCNRKKRRKRKRRSARPQGQDELLARGWARCRRAIASRGRAHARRGARLVPQLAESHYENFHSHVVPAQGAAPAFSRHLRLLPHLRRSGRRGGRPLRGAGAADLWGRELDACYEGRARHPVFVALAETIRACSIPKEPFADLLTAFRQDQTVTRYATMDDVLAYCRYSANPVGRLVLYACGEADEENFRLSDATCSALQLANFWQDVRGLRRGPRLSAATTWSSFGVSDETIAEGIATPEFRGLMRCEVDYARGSLKRDCR